MRSSPLDPDLAAGLAELPQAQQASLGAAAAAYAALTPAEQAAVRAAAEAELLDHQAGQVVEAVEDAVRRGRVPALLPRLAEAAASAAAGRHPDSPYVELSHFIEAAAALLRGDPPPPVPAAFAGQFAALTQALPRPPGGTGPS